MNQDWLVEIEQRHYPTDKQSWLELLQRSPNDVRTLIQAYKHLRKAIEKAPHGPNCDRNIAYWGTDQIEIIRSTCNCWRSQALLFNPTEISEWKPE